MDMKVLTSTPRWSGPFEFLIAMTESERGQPDVAGTILEEIVEEHPRNLQARSMLCQIYEGQQKWKRALDCLTSLHEADPESIAPLFFKAKILKLLGRNAEALHAVDEVLRYTPDQIPALRLRDDLRRTLGR